MAGAIAFFILALSMSAADVVSPDAGVVVRVRTAAGSAVRDAYVAVVPEWRTARAPAAEQIAPSGTAAFRVAPGRYFVVAGAPGHTIESAGPHEIGGAGAELAVTISPLTSRTGTVVNADGAPIAGARVATVNGAMMPAVGKLSDLAVRHLSRDFSAVTDSEGRWRLRVADGALPLYFEAPGHAPLWSVISDDTADSTGVTLPAGAALTVTTDRADADLIVTLARDNASPSGVPAERQRLVWARSAAATILTWTALPPGSYTVRARYAAPSWFMASPMDIGTVVLAPGQHQQLHVNLPRKSERVASRTALFVSGLSPSELGERVETFGSGAGGQSRPLQNAPEEVMGGTVLHIRLEEGAGPPFAGLTDEHFIASADAPAEADGEAGGTPLAATVHWRADAGVQFRSLDQELQIPRGGIARLRGCRNGGEPVVPFDIRASGFALFAVPAECRTMVLDLPPFEPAVTTQMLRRGEQNLGELVLRAAAQAEVRVISDADQTPVPNATVEVVARIESEHAAAPVLVARAVTDDAGRASFAALPAYRELRVSAVSAGGARSESVPLRLEPRQRGVIDPLRLGQPAGLIVKAAIEKSFLARFPSARISTLFVTPADPLRVSEKLQQKASEGEVRFAPLAPGEWVVSALAIVSSSSYAPFELGVVQLKAGETERIETEFTPLVFEGVVTAEEKPVAAKLMLEDGDRVLGAQSDSAGRFQLVLERAGIYRVAVARMSAQGNAIPVGEVAFTDTASPVRIAIPASAAVTVRAYAGERPVPAQTLIAASRRNASGMADRLTRRGRAADSSGEVTFEDLAPGLWTFSINDTRIGSAETSVPLEAGQRLTIELPVTDAPLLAGTVRDLGGMSIPHVRIDCIHSARPGNVDRTGTVSDAEGRFTIALAAPSPYALCSFAAGNGVVDAFKATPGDDRDIIVPAATGTLRVQDWGDVQNHDALWLVGADGRPVSLSATATGYPRTRGALDVPALAAGRWKIVRVEALHEWLAIARGMGAGLPALVEFTVEAGAARTVSVTDRVQ